MPQTIIIGSTVWLDGNPSQYRYWQWQSVFNPLYQCFYMISNGRWRDDLCIRSFRYVCKGIYFFLKVYLWLHFTARLHSFKLAVQSTVLAIGL